MGVERFRWAAQTGSPATSIGWLVLLVVACVSWSGWSGRLVLDSIVG